MDSGIMHGHYLSVCLSVCLSRDRMSDTKISRQQQSVASWKMAEGKG